MHKITNQNKSSVYTSNWLLRILCCTCTRTETTSSSCQKYPHLVYTSNRRTSDLLMLIQKRVAKYNASIDNLIEEIGWVMRHPSETPTEGKFGSVYKNMLNIFKFVKGVHK